MGVRVVIVWFGSDSGCRLERWGWGITVRGTGSFFFYEIRYSVTILHSVSYNINMFGA